MSSIRRFKLLLVGDEGVGVGSEPDAVGFSLVLRPNADDFVQDVIDVPSKIRVRL